MNRYLITLGIFVLFLSFVSAKQTCSVYDDFSSGDLGTSKWEIRQDTEGQPLMEEFNVTNESGNFAFHTQQNTIADRRVYLFPKRQFTTGDSIEYDVDLISSEGTYAQMVLLTGDQSIRIGMRGTAAGFDELGVAHMKLTFQENNLAIERKTPSDVLLIDNLGLTNSNGTYEFYIGSFSGSNGRVHMDFDNFVICSEETLEDRLNELEQRVEELETKTSLLEELVDRIIEFIESFPRGLSKSF